MRMSKKSSESVVRSRNLWSYFWLLENRYLNIFSPSLSFQRKRPLQRPSPKLPRLVFTCLSSMYTARTWNSCSQHSVSALMISVYLSYPCAVEADLKCDLSDSENIFRFCRELACYLFSSVYWGRKGGGCCCLGYIEWLCILRWHWKVNSGLQKSDGQKLTLKRMVKTCCGRNLVVSEPEAFEGGWKITFVSMFVGWIVCR